MMTTTYAGNKHEERAVATRDTLPFSSDIIRLILSFLPSCGCVTTLAAPGYVYESPASVRNFMSLHLVRGCLLHHKTFDRCPRRWRKLFASSLLPSSTRPSDFLSSVARLERFAEAVMARGWDMDECPMCVMCARVVVPGDYVILARPAPEGLQLKDFGVVGPACTKCRDLVRAFDL